MVAVVLMGGALDEFDLMECCQAMSGRGGVRGLEAIDAVLFAAVRPGGVRGCP